MYSTIRLSVLRNSVEPSDWNFEQFFSRTPANFIRTKDIPEKIEAAIIEIREEDLPEVVFVVVDNLRTVGRGTIIGPIISAEVHRLAMYCLLWPAEYYHQEGLPDKFKFVAHPRVPDVDQVWKDIQRCLKECSSQVDSADNDLAASEKRYATKKGHLQNTPLIILRDLGRVKTHWTWGFGIGIEIGVIAGIGLGFGFIRQDGRWLPCFGLIVGVAFGLFLVIGVMCALVLEIE